MTVKQLRHATAELLLVFNRDEFSNVLGEALLTRITCQETTCFIDLSYPAIEVGDEDGLRRRFDKFMVSLMRLFEGSVPTIESQGGYPHEEQRRNRSHVRETG